MRTIITSIVATLAVLTALFLIFVYSGSYNVAASEPPGGLENWVMTKTMVKSVRARAETIDVPSMADSSMIIEGFREFEEMCVTCHGAPGVEASAIGKGLQPEAPELSEIVDFWSAAELYWIIAHGIKMTGMPAFGETHDDSELWNVVAFLQRLPDLSPEAYEAMQKRMTPHSEGSHEH